MKYLKYKLCLLSTLFLFRAQAQEPLLSIPTGHTGAGVLDIAISTDGKYIFSGGHDQSVVLWELETGKELIKMQEHSGIVYSVALSYDGKLAISGSNDGTVIIWNLVSGEIQRKLSNGNLRVNSVDISPDGKYVIAGLSSNNKGSKSLKIWNVDTGMEPFQFATKPKEGASSTWNPGMDVVKYSASGKYIVSGSDEMITLWNATSG